MNTESTETSQQVKDEFLKELNNLLNKYSTPDSLTEMEILHDDEIKQPSIIVTIPSVYSNYGECLREFTEIDLGSFINGS